MKILLNNTCYKNIFVSVFKNSKIMSVYNPYESYYAGI